MSGGRCARCSADRPVLVGPSGQSGRICVTCGEYEHLVRWCELKGKDPFAVSEMRRLEALMGPDAPHRKAAQSLPSAATAVDDSDEAMSTATSSYLDAWPKDVSMLDPDVAKKMRAEYRKLYMQSKNKTTAAATRMRAEKRMLELLEQVRAAIDLA
jgi:hypothetical protein